MRQSVGKQAQGEEEKEVLCVTPDDFDIAEIEQMEVEFITCPHCKGEGRVGNGIIKFTCPVCAGCEVVPVKKEVKNANL